MEKSILIFIIFVTFSQWGFTQSENLITKIDADIEQRRSSDADFESNNKCYEYLSGENYKNEKWSKEEIANDSLTLFQVSSVIRKKDMGYWAVVDTFSISGDWAISSDNYYDAEGNLYFVYWVMNTFYAIEPVTVEKSMYFDEKGNLIRELETVYKMNTKEKTDIEYMEKEVEYKTKVQDLDFFKHCFKYD